MWRVCAVPVESTAEAEEAWTRTCQEVADMTLFPKADSWIFGANARARRRRMVNLAGPGNYRNSPAKACESGCVGFELNVLAPAE